MIEGILHIPVLAKHEPVKRHSTQKQDVQKKGGRRQMHQRHRYSYSETWMLC